MSEIRKTIPKKGYKLPDEDHVMRHIPWSKLRKDENDNVLGLLPQAFGLRPNEDALSVNWLQFFDGDHSGRIKKSINELRSANNIGPKSAFGVASVGDIKAICAKSSAAVKVVYAPTHRILSHSEIQRLPRDDLLTLEALATDAFVEIILNSTVPKS